MGPVALFSASHFLPGKKFVVFVCSCTQSSLLSELTCLTHPESSRKTSTKLLRRRRGIFKNKFSCYCLKVHPKSILRTIIGGGCYKELQERLSKLGWVENSEKKVLIQSETALEMKESESSVNFFLIGAYNEMGFLDTKIHIFLNLFAYQISHNSQGFRSKSCSKFLDSSFCQSYQTNFFSSLPTQFIRMKNLIINRAPFGSKALGLSLGSTCLDYVWC